MVAKKLIIDDFFEEVNYTLIAIHCSLDDFRLAYFLNKHLNLYLKRNYLDLDFRGKTSYSFFEWKDDKQQIIWNLVSNICKIEEQESLSKTNLLIEGQGIIKTYHLIPEQRKVNYFLKISDDNIVPQNRKAILNKIQNIPQIITAYTIDASKLKSKTNLIFY